MNGLQDFIPDAARWSSMLPVFVLALARVLGMVVVAPVLGVLHVPRSVLLAVACVFAALVTPAATDPVGVGVLSLDGIELALGVLREGALGFFVGAIAALPMLLLQGSGVLVSIAAGLGTAQVYDPAASADADIGSRVTWWAASAAFLATGGIERAAGVVVRSFESLPVCAALSPWERRGDVQPADALVGVLRAGLDGAVFVCAPAVLALIGTMFVVGVVGRLLPRVQAAHATAPAMIALGIALLAWSAGRVASPVAAVIEGVETRTSCFVGHSPSTVGHPRTDNADRGGRE